MDMSFLRAPGHAPAPARLDYPLLLALLRAADRPAAGGRPPHVDLPVDPCPVSCLAHVLLGRTEWRGAARALGNRFAPPCLEAAGAGDGATAPTPERQPL